MGLELSDNITFDELYKLIGRLTAERYALERELNKLMSAYQELANAGSKLEPTNDSGPENSSSRVPKRKRLRRS